MIQTLLCKIKLTPKLTFLMVVSLSLFSCAYNPKKLTPRFIDADRMTTREYKVIETKPKIIFQYVQEHPLREDVLNSGGLLCLPVPQALEIKRKWEQHNRKNKNSYDPLQLDGELQSFSYENSIHQDLDILDGVENVESSEQ